MRRLLIAGALAACNLPTTAALDPSTVVTGIYTLTATSQTDTCDPPRFVGAATVPVFANTTSIEITDEDSSVTETTFARYDLSAASGYAAQVPPATATFAPCPSGGSFSLDFTLTAANPTSFDVSDEETWSIVSPCPDTVIDAATVPAASCATRRTLHYALVQACATPCTLIMTGLVPSCTCPQGSAAATSSP
ncbi:MAG TPA: hypothetical protein VHT91_07025 [Kofleriaceae bacterium]|jgi:hypothetical protein|nr:hypothetical protein [Kofleriaceae bacterium]